MSQQQEKQQCKWESVIVRQGTGCRKWDDTGEIFGKADVLPLWIADMDFGAPPAVVEAIQKRAVHPVYGYPSRGLRYREAVVQWMAKRFQWEVKPEWMLNTPGVVPAINLTIQTFTEPGDKILIQTPVYPPFFSCVTKNRRQIVENPLRQEENGRYVMDFADMEKKLADGVKLMILCSPHNPVGRVWTREELQQVVKLCRKYNVLIFSDEIHGDLVFKGHSHIPIATLPQAGERTITCVAPSKTFNIAGLYASIALISDAQLHGRFSQALEELDLGPGNIFGLTALEAAYSHGELWLAELLEILEKNAEYVSDFINNEIPGVRVCKPEGTFLAWVDFRQLGMEQSALKEFLIHKAEVGLNDGMTFGTLGQGFMRLNFGCAQPTLTEGLQRLKNAVGYR